jgi:hypothetical protein
LGRSWFQASLGKNVWETNFDRKKLAVVAHPSYVIPAVIPAMVGSIKYKNIVIQPILGKK